MLREECKIKINQAPHTQTHTLERGNWKGCCFQLLSLQGSPPTNLFCWVTGIGCHGNGFTYCGSAKKKKKNGGWLHFVETITTEMPEMWFHLSSRKPKANIFLSAHHKQRASVHACVWNTDEELQTICFRFNSLFTSPEQILVKTGKGSWQRYYQQNSPQVNVLKNRVHFP